MLQLSELQERKLGKLLVRGFTKKQFAVLGAISKDKSRSITSSSKKISKEEKIPLSTVKLSLKILEQLGLVRIIEKDGFKKITMTKFGKVVLGILSPYHNNLTKILSQLIERVFLFFSNKCTAGARRMTDS